MPTDQGYQEIKVGNEVLRFPADMPDSEIESILAQEFSAQLPQQAGSFTANTADLNLPEASPKKFGGSMMVPEFTVTADKFSEKQRSLASRGVDIFNDLDDADLRANMGLAPDGAYAMNYLAEQLSARTGIPTEEVVRQDPETGAMLFFHPESQRWRPVDRSGTTVSDFREFGTQTGGPLLGGTIGNLLGAPALSLGPLGVPIMATSTGLGAMLGEMARLQAGKKRGVHNLSADEIWDRSAKVGKLDALFTASPVVALKLKRLIGGFMNPKGLSPDDAQRILDDLANNTENADAIRDINRVLEESGSTARLEIDAVAQAENDLGILLRESATRVDAQSIARRAAQDKANENALTEYANIMNRMEPGTELSASNAVGRSEEAQAALDAQVNQIRNDANNNVLRMEMEGRRALSEYGQLNTSDVGQEINRIVGAHHDVLETTMQDAYGAYQKAIGQAYGPNTSAINRFVSDIKIPITGNISAHHRAAQKLRQQSLLSKDVAGKGGLKDVQPETVVKKEGAILGLDGKPITSSVTRRQNTIDLAVLDEDIKQIRAAMRREGTDLNIRDLKRAERELVSLRNGWLKDNRPEVLAALEEAERRTRLYHDFVDESVFAGIFKRSADGRFVASNRAAFNHVFKRDPDAMQALLKIADGEIGGKEAMQRAAYQMYKDEVAVSGVPILKNHERFVAKHYDTMQHLFPNPNFTQFGRFARNLQRAEERALLIADKLKRSALYRLSGEKLAPEQLGSQVFTKGVSANDIASVRSTLGRYSKESLQAFDDAVGMEAWRRMSTEGVMDMGKLSRMLDDAGSRSALEATFGPQYVGNLRKLLRGIRMARLSPSSPQIQKTSPLLLAARAVITPPLTKRGRAQTLVERLRWEATDGFLEAAVRDPQILAELAAKRNAEISSEQVLAMFAQVNAVTALSRMDEQDLVRRPEN